MSARRLEELLGIEHPIVLGPFGGGLSTVALVAAVSESGGLGSYGANNLGPEQITGMVGEVRAATARPFAVNLWVPQPGERERPDDLARHVERLRPYYEELDVSPPDLDGPFSQDFDAQIEALLAAEPPVISFIMGVPPERVVAEARRRGIVTIGTASTVDEAVAIEAAGLDAVIASGNDAGGHRGSFLRPIGESLVGTFSLVPQVADAVSIPVIAAGGIADGRGVAAALTLGADGVQIGTGFLMTAESSASPAHRAVLNSPEARVTVLTRLFSGRHLRVIPNRFVREMAAFEDEVPPYPFHNALMLPVRRSGSADYSSLLSGQAAALARPRPAKDYFDELVSDTERILRDRV
jgi:nitronate monooxygenase